MATMTDPMDGLQSFQLYLPTGTIKLQKGQVVPDVFVHADSPAGSPRITYVRLDGETVTAFAVAAIAGQEDGLPVFQFGYAVPENFRGKGRAKEILSAAIAELTAGLGRNGIPAFYIEAVVSREHAASQRVAASAFPENPKEIEDSLTGEPCYQYLRQIET
ncbi:MAG: GNAT family N-acetyltransferase [Mesorhizobium sp.]|nr:GNAT family N-acetyltransferase [Mesorhizobium sp.]